MHKGIADATIKALDITEKLYDLYGSDQESTTSCNYREIARFLEIGESTVIDTLRHLRSLGLFSLRYGPGPIGQDGKHHGRSAFWTFHGPKETALTVLKKHMEQRSNDISNRRSKSAQARHLNAEETVSITGPDPENPMKVLQPLRKTDDAEALIEAGRQYAARMDFMERKLKELKDAGIEIDRSAVHVDIDEQLEVISKILPVVNALENKIKTMTDQLAITKTKAANADHLESANKKLKLQVERMIAERVNGA